MYGSARAVGHIEGSPARSPRLPRSPRLGHRRANSGSSGCKTLSMENIQSLNAAYATSGPMYLSDHEAVGSTATYPKGTMTLGRATSRAMYGARVTAMGSTPNIATAGIPHADLLSYGDLGSLSMLHHQGTPSALLRQAVRGGGGELLANVCSERHEHSHAVNAIFFLFFFFPPMSGCSLTVYYCSGISNLFLLLSKEQKITLS